MAPSPWFARQPQRGRCGSSKQSVVGYHFGGEQEFRAIGFPGKRGVFFEYLARLTCCRPAKALFNLIGVRNPPNLLGVSLVF